MTVTVGAMLPTLFCWATAWAITLAVLVVPPQIVVHGATPLSGPAVPVIPEIDITLAAASAPASAALCASSRARYSVITSIDSAAMAIIAIIAMATSTMVTPRSPGRLVGRWDRGYVNRFIADSQFSFMATAVTVSVGGNRGVDPNRLAARPNFHW